MKDVTHLMYIPPFLIYMAAQTQDQDHRIVHDSRQMNLKRKETIKLLTCHIAKVLYS